MEWSAPWYAVVPGQAVAMERELARELSAGHPLFGLTVRTLARRQDCDDVLFAIEDGTARVAVVHLTWTRKARELPPWPSTTIHASFEAWEAEGMSRDHNDFHAE